MNDLRDTEVFVLDCQSTGATPELGDLLELGWTVTAGDDRGEPVRAHWIVPRSGRRVPRIVRELTGFRDDCLATALPPEDCWTLLENDVTARGGRARAVIHFAHFELAFLRDLHSRAGHGSDFPFDAVCLHAIARRLYPDLARRSLRALAGMHGFPADLVRRSEGHVKATAHLWRALVPELEKRGIRTWDDLHGWLETPAPKRTKRRYPLSPEKRRQLPKGPGVYRFLRSNGDILYVGKATSLKQRVASHFSSANRATERALEMLTQVSEIAVTKTESVLEAALLEHGEIMRIDPPYNVQLREGGAPGEGRGIPRAAWFASKDLLRAATAPDDEHRIGPLPSRWSVSGLGSIRAIASGAKPTSDLRARATAVPNAFAPDEATFAAGWAKFAAAPGATGGENENPDEEPPPSGWDPARVQRHLDRAWLGGRKLVRRSRWLAALADSVVVFREADDIRRRCIVIARGEIAKIADEDPASPVAVPERSAVVFDRSAYDRLRVLVTELGRILSEGGDVTVHVRRHRVVLRRA